MKKLILAIAIILSSVAMPVALVGNNAYASGAKGKVQAGIDAAGGSESTVDTKKVIENIINTMLFIVGVLSVIMIIYGGIQYVISTGDSGKVNNAKNTIMYSVIGLIVSILSYAIVGFVMSQIK